MDYDRLYATMYPWQRADGIINIETAESWSTGPTSRYLLSGAFLISMPKTRSAFSFVVPIDPAAVCKTNFPTPRDLSMLFAPKS